MLSPILSIHLSPCLPFSILYCPLLFLCYPLIPLSSLFYPTLSCSLTVVVIVTCFKQTRHFQTHLIISASTTLPSTTSGTIYADSQLVATGMWAMLQLKGIPSLKELELKDYVTIDFMGLTSVSSRAPLYESLVYRLSENGVLSHFRKVILVSSPCDKYAPVHSTRIQICKRAGRMFSQYVRSPTILLDRF